MKIFAQKTKQIQHNEILSKWEQEHPQHSQVRIMTNQEYEQFKKQKTLGKVNSIDKVGY